MKARVFLAVLVVLLSGCSTGLQTLPFVDTREKNQIVVEEFIGASRNFPVTTAMEPYLADYVELQADFEAWRKDPFRRSGRGIKKTGLLTKEQFLWEAAAFMVFILDNTTKWSPATNICVWQTKKLDESLYEVPMTCTYKEHTMGFVFTFGLNENNLINYLKVEDVQL